jgi:hypothetical protein
MRDLFIRLYDFITAPLYRRLARDLTLQLQEISSSYVDQHERLTAKLLDEILRLHMRLDDNEANTYAQRMSQLPTGHDLTIGAQLSAEDVHEFLIEVGKSTDLVETCKKYDIPLSTYMQLEAKYRGHDPGAIRRLRLVEATNFELMRLLSTLVAEKNLSSPQATEAIGQKQETVVQMPGVPSVAAQPIGNGNGRG